MVFSARKRSPVEIDWPLLRLWLVTFFLALLGLFFVFEASTVESYQMFGHPYHFIRQQAMWMLLSLVAGVSAFCVPISVWKRVAPFLYLGSLFLLFLVFIPGIGISLNGAHRWIDLRFTLLQPVELFKFSLIIFLASWLTKHQKFLPFLFWLGLPSGLILLQPDMGSLIVVTAIAVGLYFIAGARLKHLSWLVFLGALAGVLAIMLAPYRVRRLTTFFNPEADPLGAGFHVRQMTLALGNGSWFGQGLGNSSQKYAYIPEASSDSIFAIVAEEVGLVGSYSIMGVFMFFLSFGFLMMREVKAKTFEWLVGMGILLWWSIQIVLNLSAVVALVPLTGIPLPLISYGGSALSMFGLTMGVFSRIALERKKTTSDRHVR